MMPRAALAIVAACALLAACAWPVVRAERYGSPDAALDMVVVVREAPDKKQEATHEVFVGIGRRGDNPADRFLHQEYRYLLKGRLDWRVSWQSSDMVTLHIFEHSPDKPGEPRDVAVLVFVRDEITGEFRALQTEEESRREVA